MSDMAQGPGWWQASDGRWYPPAGSESPVAAALPTPGWVRPVYLYFLCLVGVAIMALGALGALLGAVHLAAPDLSQGDPITRIATAIIEVADATLADLEEPAPASDGGSDEFSGDFGTDTGTVRDTLGTARDEIRNQSRDAATNELVRGLLFFGIGALIYAYHLRQAEPRVPKPVWATTAPAPYAPSSPPPPPPPPA